MGQTHPSILAVEREVAYCYQRVASQCCTGKKARESHRVCDAGGGWEGERRGEEGGDGEERAREILEDNLDREEQRN